MNNNKKINETIEIYITELETLLGEVVFAVNLAEETNFCKKDVPEEQKIAVFTLLNNVIEGYIDNLSDRKKIIILMIVMLNQMESKTFNEYLNKVNSLESEFKELKERVNEMYKKVEGLKNE